MYFSYVMPRTFQTLEEVPLNGRIAFHTNHGGADRLCFLGAFNGRSDLGSFFVGAVRR